MFESHHQLQKKREQVADLLSFFQRCLPLRARDVDFISDVHCVSDVTPYGVVGKHLITLRQRRKTSLCDSTTSHRRSRYITNCCKQFHTLQKQSSLFFNDVCPYESPVFLIHKPCSCHPERSVSGVELFCRDPKLATARLILTLFGFRLRSG